MAVLEGKILNKLVQAMLDKMACVKVLFDEKEYEGYLGYGDTQLELREIDHPELGDASSCRKLRKLLRQLIHPCLDIIIMNKYNDKKCGSPIGEKRDEVLRDIHWRLDGDGEDGVIPPELILAEAYTLSGLDIRTMDQLIWLLPERRLAEKAIKELLELAKRCKAEWEDEARKSAYEERRELTERCIPREGPLPWE